ncbi:MAG: hypothetical protein RLZZ76_541 [Candidatus Parcubacteria bacterium]|jgi:methionine synthase I (cobalamin-dependent)
MAKKQTAIGNAQKLGLGVGLTAAAVAAAGAYFLYGSKSAPKNRKTVKSWALKAKGEVLEALEKADKMTAGEFDALVAGVLGTYSKAQKISKAELADFKNEMGNNWSGLVKSGVAKVFQTATPVAVEAGKKAVKKAVVKKKVTERKRQ